MGTELEREWKRLLKKEERMLHAAESRRETKLGGKLREWTGKAEEKIPEKLSATLDAAFYQAFLTIFEKGTGVIEKTLKGDELRLEFQVNDFRMEQKPTKRSLKKMDAPGKKSILVHSAVTTAEGIGLGLLGVGIPDIPIFLSMLLRSLYEMASSYGYAYDQKEEQVYLLRLICAGLAEGAEKREKDRLVDAWTEETEATAIFTDEVRQAASALSDAMLTAKFIQGLPLVGAVGGVSNPLVYQKIMGYAALKYKKRYLAGKRKGA